MFEVGQTSSGNDLSNSNDDKTRKRKREDHQFTVARIVSQPSISTTQNQLINEMLSLFPSFLQPLDMNKSNQLASYPITPCSTPHSNLSILESVALTVPIAATNLYKVKIV